MKLWDIRSFKRHVNMADGLFSRFDQTDCSFSPDNKMVITGRATVVESPDPVEP
jgi:hypothetical protein